MGKKSKDRTPVAVTPVSAAALAAKRAEYESDKGSKRPMLSASIANLIVNESPLHAWQAHPRLGGVRREMTPQMIQGSVLHALILRDERSRVVVVDADDFRSSAAREAKAAALESGAIPVSRSQFERAREVSEQIRGRIKLLGFDLDVGETESPLYWTEQLPGRRLVHCKGRTDKLYLASGITLDLKSTDSAHPRSIAQSMVRYGYDIQRAAYVRGLERSQPRLAGRAELVFLFFETEPPYAVTPAVCDGEMRALGERKWDRAVETWWRCLHRGIWPAYAEKAVAISPPRWAVIQEEEDAA